MNKTQEALERIISYATSYAGSFATMKDYENTKEDIETIRTALQRQEELEQRVKELESISADLTLCYMTGYNKAKYEMQQEISRLRTENARLESELAVERNKR